MVRFVGDEHLSREVLGSPHSNPQHWSMTRVANTFKSFGEIATRDAHAHGPSDARAYPQVCGRVACRMEQRLRSDAYKQFRWIFPGARGVATRGVRRSVRMMRFLW